MKSKTILAIFLVGVALRVTLFWRTPLWYDENYSLIVARLPLAQITAALLGDVHPPLWYAAIWIWVHIFPAVPWIIRLPSVLISIASLFVYWQVLQTMTDNPRIRTVALLLMAIAPVQIYYAQEGRMYAMLEFFVLAAWWSILEKKWGYLAVEIAALALTQNLGLLYAACLYVAALLYDNKSWKPLTVSMIAAALLWAPWAPAMIHQMTSIYGRHWIPPLTFGDALYNLAQMFWTAITNLRLELLAMVLFFAWVMFGVVYAFLRRPLRIERTIVLMVLGFGPWLAEVIASAVWQPILLHRTLIGITPFLYLLMASPAAIIFKSRTSVLFAACLILPPLVAWYGTFWFASNNIDDLKEFSAVIERDWQLGDVVYHVTDSTIVNLWPYTTVETGHVYKQPDCAVTIGGLTDETRQAMGFPVQYLDALSPTPTRAWIFTDDNPFGDKCEREHVQSYLDTAQLIGCAGDQYAEVCLYLWSKP